MCNEVILSYKILNTRILFTVNFWGFFSLYSCRNSIQSKGDFFIHVSSSSWILVRFWDLQLIHDKALVCCCRSFHQKYYLKKRVFIIRIDIIIRHWKKKYWKKPLLDCHCQSVGMSYYNCACNFFLNCILYRRYCKNGGICGWSTELTWWNYVLHPMETWSWQYRRDFFLDTWNTKKVQFLSICNVHCLISLKMHRIKTKLDRF